MLAHSLPRAVRSSCPQPASRTAENGSAAAATSSSNPYHPPHSRTSHQRRRSSSKASSPGGQRPPDQAASNASPTALESDRRSQSRTSRRKGGNVDGEVAKSKSTQVTPVPSTQHLHPADVSISSFFSLHRPISVTTVFPTPTSAESFNAIFRSPTKYSSNDVIYTISNAVTQLEGQPREEHDLRREILNNSVSHNGKGQNEQVQVPSLEEMLKQFRPFNVPPAPVPFEDVESKETESLAAQQRREAEEAEGPHVQPIQIVDTQIDSQDTENVTAQTSQAETTQRSTSRTKPRLSASKGASRKIRSPTQKITHIWAISVRRQRRLKMKKHKYKKMRKATRTMRRRDGRI